MQRILTLLLHTMHAGEMAALQSRFDAALATCRATQLDLAVSLKAAEGQLLLMTKELEVLKVWMCLRECKLSFRHVAPDPGA